MLIQIIVLECSTDSQFAKFDATVGYIEDIVMSEFKD